MYSILETPGVYEELRSHPELMPQAVEEALRFRAPAPVLRRIAKRDTEIGGHLIKEGDMVLAFVASANRDEAKFDRPRTCLISAAIPTRILRFTMASIFALGLRLPVLKQISR